VAVLRIIRVMQFNCQGDGAVYHHGHGGGGASGKTELILSQTHHNLSHAAGDEIKQCDGLLL